MQYFRSRKILFETYNTNLDNNNDNFKNFINEFTIWKNNCSDIKDWKISLQWSDKRVIINLRKEGNDIQDNKFISLFSDVNEIYMKNVIKMSLLEGDKKIKKLNSLKNLPNNLQ